MLIPVDIVDIPFYVAFFLGCLYARNWERQWELTENDDLLCDLQDILATMALNNSTGSRGVLYFSHVVSHHYGYFA